MKKLEAELINSKENNLSWKNTVNKLQSLVDKQMEDKSVHSVNGKDEVSSPATTTNDISPQPDSKNNNVINQLIQTLNNTSIQQQDTNQITPGAPNSNHDDGDDNNNKGDDVEDDGDDQQKDTENIEEETAYKPSEKIMKLVENKQMLLNKAKNINDPLLNVDVLYDTNKSNDSILNDIQTHWMQAEAEKLKFS